MFHEIFVPQKFGAIRYVWPQLARHTHQHPLRKQNYIELSLGWSCFSYFSMPMLGSFMKKYSKVSKACWWWWIWVATHLCQLERADCNSCPFRWLHNLILKSIVNQAKVYIRALQKDLSLEEEICVSWRTREVQLAYILILSYRSKHISRRCISVTMTVVLTI